jgi:hypothetical protein
VTIQPGVVTATTYSAGGSGGGGGGGCFSADTLITMADGTLKPIVDVAVGDSVLGTDEAGVTSENTVTETFIHRGDNETLLLNGSIVVTPVHPIKTQRGWVTAGELAIGDTLYTQSGSITVSSLVPGPLLASVYNLEVEPAHTYYAGGILVHNKLSEVVQN